MTEVKCFVRKWGGSSMAVVIPKEIVTRENIKQGDEIKLLIEKEVNLSDVFGSFKTKTTGQKFKDMCKENATW